MWLEHLFHLSALYFNMNLFKIQIYLWNEDWYHHTSSLCFLTVDYILILWIAEWDPDYDIGCLFLPVSCVHKKQNFH